MITDAYKLSRATAKDIAERLERIHPRRTMPVWLFFQEAPAWIDRYQVKKDYRRECCWDAYIHYYQRRMNEQEQNELFRIYPLIEETIN